MSVFCAAAEPQGLTNWPKNVKTQEHSKCIERSKNKNTDPSTNEKSNETRLQQLDIYVALKDFSFKDLIHLGEGELNELSNQYLSVRFVIAIAAVA